MIPLPTWMRAALFATAPMNFAGAIAFLPPAGALRDIGGLPDPGHPLYGTTISLFILTFGIGYLYAAITGRADRLFIAVAAAGKLSFFGLLTFFWLTGDLTIQSPLAGSGDLLFGALFVYWLARTPATP